MASRLTVWRNYIDLSDPENRREFLSYPLSLRLDTLLFPNVVSVSGSRGDSDDIVVRVRCTSDDQETPGREYAHHYTTRWGARSADVFERFGRRGGDCLIYEAGEATRAALRSQEE